MSSDSQRPFFEEALETPNNGLSIEVTIEPLIEASPNQDHQRLDLLNNSKSPLLKVKLLNNHDDILVSTHPAETSNFECY